MAFVDETNTSDNGGGVTPGVHPAEGDRGNQVQVNNSNSGNRDEQVSEGRPKENLSSQPQAQQTLTPEKMNEVISNYVKDALSQEIVAYNALELKNNYPLTYALMVEYMNKTAHVSALDMETIVGVLLYSPRNVIFNFFDSQKIFVNIFGSDQHWRYTMEANESSEETFVNRTLCEIAGYTEAFKKLEQKLNSKPKK